MRQPSPHRGEEGPADQRSVGSEGTFHHDNPLAELGAAKAEKP
jgi:hypothetical protein